MHVRFDMAASHKVVLHLPNGNCETLNVAEDETILDAALGAGIDLPYMCAQGWCLTCAARLVKGQVVHPHARRYFEADAQAGYILPCSAQPRCNCVVETHHKADMVQYRVNHELPAPRG